MRRNHYDVLGIDQKATQLEIRKAYKKQALEFHPDKYKNDEAEEKMKTINGAHEVLTDVEKRANFDKLLKTHVFHCKNCFGGCSHITFAIIGGWVVKNLEKLQTL